MDEIKEKFLRSIPSIDELLRTDTAKELLGSYSRRMFVEKARETLSAIRESIKKAKEEEINKIEISTEKLLNSINISLEDYSRLSLSRVINATGVILHTNLGRALLPEAAVKNLTRIAEGYTNLEYDLKKGERGSRYDHISEILSKLTTAEDSLVVNNNAGAVLLCLQTLAKGKEVIVSRGELIEIGGEFRIPDIMKASGAILREVGTTNRTHLKDYISAINENTALILKVHTSNYRILGFASQISARELKDVGEQYNLPVMEDLGSGSFIDLRPLGLGYEPTVQEVVKSGIDIITFSGDKLLGGPQAGIILGKKKYIEAIKKNTLNRALRIDKFTLAGLEATLKLFLDENQAIRKIPTLRMLSLNEKDLRKRANRILRSLSDNVKKQFYISLKKDLSEVGGGALPLEQLPGIVISIASDKIPTNTIEEFFRYYQPPIIGRIKEDNFILDLRTVQKKEYPVLISAINKLPDIFINSL